MPRPPRIDGPGAWHHVMNRGVGKRTIFESRRDIRLFLSRMARTVRRGDLEIHAFCILPNHFHLLVRSTKGRISAAMAWIQDGFARYFNRTRQRTGSVFGGRFKSKPVESGAYWQTVVWYIHDNPIAHGLVSNATDYAWGSASHYALTTGPIWLTRSSVEEVATRNPLVIAPPDMDDATRGRLRRITEARLRHRAKGRDPVDELLLGSSDRVRSWVEARARNADGMRPGVLLVTPETVLEVLALPLTNAPDDLVALAAGTLRIGSGASTKEISRQLDLSYSAALRRLECYRDRMRSDPWWVGRCSDVLRECLSRDHPFRETANLGLTPD